MAKATPSESQAQTCASAAGAKELPNCHYLKEPHPKMLTGTRPCLRQSRLSTGEVNDGAWTPRFQHLGSPTVKLNSPIATLNALIVVGNPLACAEAKSGKTALILPNSGL